MNILHLIDMLYQHHFGDEDPQSTPHVNGGDRQQFNVPQQQPPTPDPADEMQRYLRQFFNNPNGWHGQRQTHGDVTATQMPGFPNIVFNAPQSVINRRNGGKK